MHANLHYTKQIVKLRMDVTKKKGVKMLFMILFYCVKK